MSILEKNVLESVKNQIGIYGEVPFDQELLTYINMSLATLAQIGVPFKVEPMVAAASSTYSEMLDDEILLGHIDAYLGLKTKLLFDPPPASAVSNALSEAVKEVEWRIMVECDNRYYNSSGGDDDG